MRLEEFFFFKYWFVNYNFNIFSFNMFYDVLNSICLEVIRFRFYDKMINVYNFRFMVYNWIGDKIFMCMVSIYNCLDYVVWYFIVVSE